MIKELEVDITKTVNLNQYHVYTYDLIRDYEPLNFIMHSPILHIESKMQYLQCVLAIFRMKTLKELFENCFVSQEDKVMARKAYRAMKETYEENQITVVFGLRIGFEKYHYIYKLFLDKTIQFIKREKSEKYF